MRSFRCPRAVPPLALLLAAWLGGCRGGPDAAATPDGMAMPTLAAAPSPKPVAPPPPASLSEGQTYVVESGDSLGLIAQKVYGDASRWQQIYQANEDVIGAKPEAIQVGMTLKTPPKL